MYHGWTAAKASGEVVEPSAILEAAFKGVTKETAVVAGKLGNAMQQPRVFAWRR